MERAWFINDAFISLTIEKYKSISDHKVVSSVKIDDLKVIRSFVERIKKIPANGDMMISFGGNASHTNLLFKNGNQVEEIGIYESRFKTPSTGFNIGKGELEEELYRDIEALLFPDYNKAILKIENLEVFFKDFSITYLGSEFKDHAPATISFTTDKFLVREKNKKEELIGISYGQLPPQPFFLKLNTSEITLRTFQTNVSKRLFPDYFEVVKSK